MMTSAQVVETSVTVTDNSPFQDYPHPDDHTTQSTATPGFKPFTVKPFTVKYLKPSEASTVRKNVKWSDEYGAKDGSSS